jgi:hypothetical protein
VAAEGGFKLRNLRHHEAELCVLIGELALQIQKIRARNMSGLERVPPGHDEIGNTAAGGLIFEIGGAVEDTQIALAHKASKFLGRNQPATLRHATLPQYELPDARPGRPPMERQSRPFNLAL